MSINKDQARMLTALAVACRPVGASRWDDEGVFRSIGKIQHWSLPIVIEHVIRHAADPKAKTPGVIGSSHTPAELGMPTATPPRKHEQCGRCGGVLPDCACRREHLAATYDDDQETTRMDAETALRAARDAIHAAKGDVAGTETEEAV
jgi:hypothetical protein